MSETETPKVTRRQHITREEEADRCLNHTVYSHGSQFMAVFFFLLVVFGVPLAQHVVEIRQNMAKQAEWSPTSGQPKPGLAPQIYDVFGLLPSGDKIKQAKGFWGYWDLIPSMESISSFETSLKENSVLTTSLLSPTQLLMSSLLGAGNEKAYVGKDGWLFYRPDVEYLTTPGFLEPSRLKDRSHGATEIQPDPVKAILDFKDQLEKRGIQLVVMPMSTKPMIQPEKLVGPSAEGANLQNDSFAQFQSTLESKGVHVFDPTSALRELKASKGSNLYLQSDTHWGPDAMHEVAMKLGEFLDKSCGLHPATQNAFDLKPEQITNLGDIAEMLKLPKDQNLFAKQTVTIQKVVGKDGRTWAPDRSGEVLLLGDSFSNIFSLEGMAWGSSAGFAEHLSYAVGKGIDKIVINAGGSFASRRELARQLAHGVDHLANKRVVVYEFSMRDLAQGDWKMIKLPEAPPRVRPVEPIKVPVTPINPTAPVTLFRDLKVEPSTLDLSKHDNVKITVSAPPGNMQISIVTADGKTVRKLSGSGSTVDHVITDRWDGKDVQGRLVAVGNYQVKVDGERPDHSPIVPVLANLVVSNGNTKPPVAPPPVNPVPPTQGTKPAGTTPPTGTKPPGGTTPVAPPKANEEGMFVTGRIASRPVTPKPGSVPYKDCLIALQLTDLKVTGGTVKGQNIVVYVWGMKDNKLVDGAYSVGQTLRFKLAPWASVESKYGGYNRQELESDDALSWDAFWGEIK